MAGFGARVGTLEERLRRHVQSLAGARYDDTVEGSPGADDNPSRVADLIGIGRA